MFAPSALCLALCNGDNVLPSDVCVVVVVFLLLPAGEKLTGVQLSPSNQQEMKSNVERVLQFVASKKIRMHQTSAKGQLVPHPGEETFSIEWRAPLGRMAPGQQF